MDDGYIKRGNILLLKDGLAIDQSGSGNVITNNGATPCPDHNGRANRGWGFDGVDDKLVVPNSLIRGKTKLTIVASVYGSSGWFFGQTNTKFNLLLYNNRFYLQFTSSDNVSSSTTFSLNTYYLVAVVIDLESTPKTAKIYANGVDVTGTPYGTFPSSINNEDIQIALASWSIYFTAQRTDYLSIFNRALTESEIKKLYNYWRTH